MIKAALKRCLDLVAATCLLIVSAPLIFLAAIAIKLESPGPVFFCQERVGKNGTRFRIWKLRSMANNAVNEGAGLMTFQNDPRITRVGAWLRKYRIDELPQVFNILHGEMSLVGPRPLLAEYLPNYSERDRRRLLVKPGATGWQQVNGGSRNTWDERITLDLWYVDHWSIWLDLKVLFLTVLVVLKADSVYGSDGWQRSGQPTNVSPSGAPPSEQ